MQSSNYILVTVEESFECSIQHHSNSFDIEYFRSATLDKPCMNLAQGLVMSSLNFCAQFMHSDNSFDFKCVFITIN